MEHTQGPRVLRREDAEIWKGDTIIALAVGDEAGPDKMIQRYNDWPALLEALERAERVIRWAAQEAAGRVKSEIVGGWLHHADAARAAIKQAVK